MAIVRLYGETVEVEDDVLGVVSEIKRLYPNLTVQFLGPDRAGVGDAPYRIVEHTAQGPQHVMSVWCLDNSVIHRLHMANSQFFDIEKELAKANEKAKKEQEKKSYEEGAAAADVAASAVTHFRKGKLKFQYRDDNQEKRVIDGSR